MTITLTLREKKLLYALGLLLFLAATFQWGVLPALQARADARAARDAAQQARAQMEQDLAQSGQLAADAAASAAELAQALQGFYPRMSGDALDALVSGLALEHGLTPRTLELSAPQPAAFAGYGGTAPAAQAESGLPDGFLLCATVHCTVTGTEEAFRDMLDALAGQAPGMRLLRFEVGDLLQQEDAGPAGQFSYVVAIYMYDEEVLP